MRGGVAIRVKSRRMRGLRRRRLYGSLARWTSVDGSPRACKFLANSCVWAARFSQLKGAKFINNQLPSKSEFALHPYYSSSRKGFPSHLSSLVTFSETIELTQRMHSWIAFNLKMIGKLVWSQLNSRILSYNHFCGEILRKNLSQVWRHTWSGR